MDRALVLFAAVTLLAIPVTGCIAGDDAGPTDTNQTPDDGASGNTSEEGNESGNETSEEPGTSETGENETAEDDQPRWERDNRTGEVSGLDAGVTGPNASESVEVSEDTETMFLNLTTDGGELEMRARPPGCEDAGCEETATTQDGNASLEIAAPEPGSYNVTLETTGPGAHDISYELAIASKIVPADDDTRGGFGA